MGHPRLMVGIGSVLTLPNGLSYCPNSPFVKHWVHLRIPPSILSILSLGTCATSQPGVLDTGGWGEPSSTFSLFTQPQSPILAAEGIPHLEVPSLSILNQVLLSQSGYLLTLLLCISWIVSLEAPWSFTQLQIHLFFLCSCRLLGWNVPMTMT